MSAPTWCETIARAWRRSSTSAPETSISTVVTGYRDRRRMRSMLAPCSAIAAATAATCCVASGAPMTTTAARPVRRGALSPWPATRSTRIPSCDPARVSRSTSTFSSRPGESSTDSARWPRTTTCSRSSTSAPTVEAASNSALVTPGRSGPFRVTRRVRACGSGSGATGGSIGAGGTRAGYRAWASRHATRSRTGPRSWSGPLRPTVNSRVPTSWRASAPAA